MYVTRPSRLAGYGSGTVRAMGVKFSTQVGRVHLFVVSTFRGGACSGVHDLGWFEKNRFLESAAYNKWKSGLIPLEHHMQIFSAIGKVSTWALCC